MKPTIRMSLAVFSLAALAAGSFALAQIPRTPSPAGAKVYFIQPRDGATVKGPVEVVMGLSGMGIAPAGIDSPDTGHHHVLIDVDKLDPTCRFRQTTSIAISAGDRPRRGSSCGRQAHAAARARRPETYPAQPAGDEPQDHDHRSPVTDPVTDTGMREGRRGQDGRGLDTMTGNARRQPRVPCHICRVTRS